MEEQSRQRLKRDTFATCSNGTAEQHQLSNKIEKLVLKGIALPQNPVHLTFMSEQARTVVDNSLHVFILHNIYIVITPQHVPQQPLHGKPVHHSFLFSSFRLSLFSKTTPDYCVAVECCSLV